MRVAYAVKGEKRKELAQAIASELGDQLLYLGVPSFAYQVGCYTLDKEGTLEGPDNQDLIADLQGLHDFVPVEETYDVPSPESEPAPENPVIPWEAELGGRVSPYNDYAEPPSANVDQAGTTTIEMPLDGFTEQAFGNLRKLIASKEGLIKKAIGATYLPILETESTLKFPWFPGGTADEAKAYTQFIEGLCKLAKKRQRVTAKERALENEKYAFRVFLIQLGMIGDDYKTSRRILLRNLTGNSAFRDGAPQ